MTFACKFNNYFTHLDNDVLNKAYGDKGMFFKTRREAESFVGLLNKKYWITRLSNYKAGDFEDVCEKQKYKWKLKSYKIKEDAKKHEVGFLVTIQH